MLQNLYYKNKYRIDSARLSFWNYSQSGYYYITICTKDRIFYFGEIIDDKMRLNEIGYIAKRFWRTIPRYYKYMKLDSFIVMPNHIHGILKIVKSVETHNCASLQRQSCKNKFGPQSKNISAAVRAFKSSVKKYANDSQIDFVWQSGFYDHVIRNKKELYNIRKYIKENPVKWQFDRNYK